jgi:chromosome segregation ATPase
LAQVNARFVRIDERFAQVDERFAQVDERFVQIDERFVQVDERFKQVDERFKQVDERFAQVDNRFEHVDNRFTDLEASMRSEFRRLTHYIASESEQTRRHFDVVAEQMRSERNLVLDLGLTSAERAARLSRSHIADRERIEHTLADHERRLQELEGKDDVAP